VDPLDQAILIHRALQKR